VDNPLDELQGHLSDQELELAEYQSYHHHQQEKIHEEIEHIITKAIKQLPITPDEVRLLSWATGTNPKI
jgi:hypothetical protein